MSDDDVRASGLIDALGVRGVIRRKGQAGAGRESERHQQLCRVPHAFLLGCGAGGMREGSEWLHFSINSKGAAAVLEKGPVGSERGRQLGHLRRDLPESVGVALATHGRLENPIGQGIAFGARLTAAESGTRAVIDIPKDRQRVRIEAGVAAHEAEDVRHAVHVSCMTDRMQF